MLKKELILKDTLKFLGHETDEYIKNGGFGAVVARAGVGKTAFLVQVAISTLFREKNVLHISIKDPVEKVNLWYREMFQNITKPYDAKHKNRLWEELLAHRFIMTFETEGFNFNKLKERITGLITEDIFTPHMIIIDGVLFDSSLFRDLVELKKFARENSAKIWFSVRTHRHKTSDPDMLLQQPGEGSEKLFDIVFQIIPEKEHIRLKSFTFSNKIVTAHPELFLDPATMLIRKGSKK